jgi:site-specific recombinase XerD
MSVSISEVDKMSRPVRKYLMPEEVERLLVRVEDPTDKILIQLGLSMGCRVSEIISIRLLSIKSRVIEIWDEKKDEYRHCVIDARTEEALKIYLRDHYKQPHGVRTDAARLFYFSDKTANRKIKAAFEKAEISREVPWRWHTLRHTYVRHMLDTMKDKAIQFICEQTGDSPRTILAEYGVPSIDERIAAANDTGW